MRCRHYPHSIWYQKLYSLFKSICHTAALVPLTDAELRANLFAAEGLIEDDELLELLHNGYTRKAAASELMVPVLFIDCKIWILREYDMPLKYVDMLDTLCLGEDITGKRNLWR